MNRSRGCSIGTTPRRSRCDLAFTEKRAWSPQVYRRLKKVLPAQGATIDVVHVLRPLIVIMAGAGEIDLYKD